MSGCNLRDVTPTYKIDELAAEAGVSPRTVRYYVQRGLLPAPEFRGKDTVYGRDHLLRLQAIKRLQQQHMPLDEIQVRLQSASDVELLRIAKGEAPPGGRAPFEEPRDTGTVRRGHPYRAPSGEPLRDPFENPFVPYPVYPPEGPAVDPIATAQVYTLAPGVELWVRGGLQPASRALVREILNRYFPTNEDDKR